MPIQIDPKEITITTQSGEEKKFIISKMPYASAGREILTQFIPTAAPKIGHYPSNHELMLKMMKYVAAVTSDGKHIELSTPGLVDNHVTDFITGVTLEKEMLEYNFGFFDQGKISASLENIVLKFKQKILPILTDLVAQSSQKAGPPSPN